MTSQNGKLRNIALYGQGANNLCIFDTEAYVMKPGGREYHTIVESVQENGWRSELGQISKVFSVSTSSKLVELVDSGDHKTYAIAGLSPQVDIVTGMVSIFFFDSTNAMRAVNTNSYTAIPATDSYIKAVTVQDPLPVLDPLATTTNAVTATSISATLDVAYATKVYAIYTTVAEEYAAFEVVTGYAVINTPGSKASLRLGRSDAEAGDFTTNSISCYDYEWINISFRAKLLKGAPSVKIRCYDSLGTAHTLVETVLYEGNLVKASTSIDCTLSSTLTRFSASIRVPVGGRYIDVAVESPTGVAGGDHVCFITSYMAASTDVDIPYYPSATIGAVTRPLSVVDGNAGDVLSTDGRGNTEWIAPGGGGGGGGALDSINGLNAAAQFITAAKTVADIDGISIASGTATHAISVAAVETLTTTTFRGLLLKSDYDIFKALSTLINPPTGPMIFSNSIVPSAADTYDLGSATDYWQDIFAKGITLTDGTTLGYGAMNILPNGFKTSATATTRAEHTALSRWFNGAEAFERLEACASAIGGSTPGFNFGAGALAPTFSFYFDTATGKFNLTAPLIVAGDLNVTGNILQNGVTFAPVEAAQIYSMFWS